MIIKQLQFYRGKLIPLYYMSMYFEKETQFYIYLVIFFFVFTWKNFEILNVFRVIKQIKPLFYYFI